MEIQMVSTGWLFQLRDSWFRFVFYHLSFNYYLVSFDFKFHASG